MENVLIEFKKKAKKQNIIKAGLCSVAISLLFNIPFLIAFWIMDYKYKFIICTGIFIIGISVLFPVLYFKKFKYTEIQLAKRIDDLGLEERVLTMIELKDNNSFIAKKQKEDTLNVLKTVEANDLKGKYRKQSFLSIFSTALASLVITLSLMFPNIRETIIAHGEPKYTIEVSAEGLGFVIDYSKYENQSLINAVSKKQEQDQIDKINNKEIVELKQFPTAFSNRISVNYRCFEDIDATMVLDGANFEDISYRIKSDEVHILMALPYKGYVFIGWSDGCASPFREIDNYSTNLIALFDEVSSVGEDLPDKQEEPGDKDESNGGESDGIGPEGNGTGKTNNDDSWGDGAKGSPANQVINGETYYGDIFNQSYQEAVERIKNDTNLTDAQKKAITDYFESIRKN
jgi:hypothetical protein